MNDYARIKAKLDIQLREQQQQLEQAHGRMSELQDELGSIQQCLVPIQAEQIAAQSEAARLHRLVQEAEQEAQIAEGTSLHSAKAAAFSHLQSEMAAAMQSVEALQTAYAHDSQAFTDTQAELSDLTQLVSTLQAKHAELAATRQRFDTQHFESVRDTALGRVNSIDAEIEKTRARLASLESKRLEAVREVAASLLEWPAQAVEALV